MQSLGYLSVLVCLSVASASKCLLPANPGSCMHRWSSINGICQQVAASGCAGPHINSFATKLECETVCPAVATTTVPPVDKCTLPLSGGATHCHNVFPVWGSSGGICVNFYYSGCDGNANRFNTKAECDTACPLVAQTTTTAGPAPTVCDQSISAGTCGGNNLRWGSQNGVCVSFNYGGCLGNNNNFLSKAICESVCPPMPTTTVAGSVCLLPPPTPGSCVTTRYAAKPGKCEAFTYSGCGGNTNNFFSKAQCELECPPASQRMCNLPLEYGNCITNNPLPRYGKANGVCTRFFFSGCGGNNNNFVSKDECQRHCQQTTTTTTASTTTTTTQSLPTCQQPAHAGPCHQFEIRYYHSAGECKPFHFGGCAGNSNNFLTKETCEAACVPVVTTQTPVNLCNLPIDQGPCKAALTRYASVNGVCKTFTYGGCAGNANNFNSLSACVSRCGHSRPKPRKCKAKPSRLPSRCRRNKRPSTRWFYNSRNNSCSPSKTCKRRQGYKSRGSCERRCKD